MNTIEDTLELISSATNIVVLVGAGISVSCGIPDFRSENGIYSVSVPLGSHGTIFSHWTEAARI